MTLRMTRGLWLWFGALSMTLLLVVPLAVAWQLLVALLVVALVVRAWRRAGRRVLRLQESLQLADEACLPPAGYRQPVVLVCGDGLAAMFGGPCSAEPRLRLTAQGCYLGVADPRQLPDLVNALRERRPGWSGQISVMFVVNPGERTDTALLQAQARAVCHQLALIRRRGSALPLLVVTYLQAAQGHGPWFAWHGQRPRAQVHEAGGCVDLEGWQRRSGDSQSAAECLRTSVCLTAVGAWLQNEVLPCFARHDQRDITPVAWGVAFVPTLPGEVVGNLWRQWLSDKLALSDTRQPGLSEFFSLPFPDPLLALVPIRLHTSPLRQAGVRAIWMLAVAGLFGLASSAWQNSQLIHQVGADLHRYHAIMQAARADQSAHVLREEAVDVLRQHAARLEHYHRQGEPLALGLGLYRGEPLRTQLLLTLLDHPEPRGPREMAPIPQAISLDGLSLFDAGSARLKPESTKVLINALVGIKAQPGWLVVVAGHTEATGSAEHNLSLSRARAAAVRDWIQRMGDLPDSCFAVQGFGATQPLASNDTEDGRMSNRRVDIRLVPAQGACLTTPQVSG